MITTADAAHHAATTNHTTRVLAVVTVTGLTGLGVYVSYRHMLTLAYRHGVHGLDAHAFPLFVDGLDLISILVLLADRRAHRRSGPLPWVVLACGAVASFAANVAVAPDNLIARGISGISAIALLAAAKMLAHLFDTSTQLVPIAHPAPDLGHGVAHHRPHTPSAGSDGGTSAGGRDGDPARRRRSDDAARRVPTSPDAYARWCQIWQATRHLPAATDAVARAHNVSLRTLQFIRAAGQHGHLANPTPADGDAHTPAASAGSHSDAPAQQPTPTAAAS